MAKPRLEKVRALFYVLQQLTKRGCANFDTASTRSRSANDNYLQEAFAAYAECVRCEIIRTS